MNTISVQGGGSRFRVVPDPPIAGKPADITYIGPATQVEWQVDAGAPVSVKPDANGKFRVASMPRGAKLFLSDNLGLPGYLQRGIIDLGQDKTVKGTGQ